MVDQLRAAGWSIESTPDGADVIIVNTCSFIEPAINESVDTILGLAEYKKKGVCKNLIVTGCLPERFRETIVSTLPEVDMFLGTGAFDKIVQAVEKSETFPPCYLPDPSLSQFISGGKNKRHFSSYSAYVKTAEGCDRCCTYCIIPKLRGKQRSRTAKHIIEEARSLVDSGVRELILVAQDTTSYGKDFHPRISLGRLLEDVAKISDQIWIRVLYGHPQSVDDTFIQTVGSHKNICSYFDIPIQHASTSVLKKMGRDYTRKDLTRLFEKIRSAIPDASLRTTLITGFPGESEKDFNELFAFIDEVRFDHLGVFTYSDFDDLPSHRLANHVPANIADERYRRLMARQKEISLENNRKFIGKTLDMLVEEVIEQGLFSGRTRYQAPEVDGITYIHANNIMPGAYVDVRISDALEYDLIGEAV